MSEDILDLLKQGRDRDIPIQSVPLSSAVEEIESLRSSLKQAQDALAESDGQALAWGEHAMESQTAARKIESTLEEKMVLINKLRTDNYLCDRCHEYVRSKTI